jgi:hypothetical protein
MLIYLYVHSANSDYVHIGGGFTHALTEAEMLFSKGLRALVMV